MPMIAPSLILGDHTLWEVWEETNVRRREGSEGNEGRRGDLRITLQLYNKVVKKDVMG
jgi:hypothetical protein